MIPKTKSKRPKNFPLCDSFSPRVLALYQRMGTSFTVKTPNNTFLFLSRALRRQNCSSNDSLFLKRQQLGGLWNNWPKAKRAQNSSESWILFRRRGTMTKL